MSAAVRPLTPAEAAARRGELVDLLVDAVENGAGVNFVLPLERATAERWWDGALADHASGGRVILAAISGGRLDGSVQLVPAPQQNQPHRADIAKLLVHSRARRQGLGAALMQAAEAEALRLGRTLLTLDTEKDGAAERLYLRLGWTRFGEVPGFALRADGSARQTASFFWKELDPGA